MSAVVTAFRADDDDNDQRTAELPSPVVEVVPPFRGPYPGLRPFFQEDAPRFFGRGRQINQMLERLEDRRFLVVVGVSGCGKSSLVQAGLLPALEKGYLMDALAHGDAASR